jgi:hypothetical protein
MANSIMTNSSPSSDSLESFKALNETESDQSTPSPHRHRHHHHHSSKHQHQLKHDSTFDFITQSTSKLNKFFQSVTLKFLIHFGSWSSLNPIELIVGTLVSNHPFIFISYIYIYRQKLIIAVILFRLLSLWLTFNF